MGSFCEENTRRVHLAIRALKAPNKIQAKGDKKGWLVTAQPLLYPVGLQLRMHEKSFYLSFILRYLIRTCENRKAEKTMNDRCADGFFQRDLRWVLYLVGYMYMCYLDWFGGISSERIIVIVKNSKQRTQKESRSTGILTSFSKFFSFINPHLGDMIFFLVSESESDSAPSSPCCLDGYVLAAAAPCHSPVVFARLMPESRLAASALLHARPALGAASRAATEECQGAGKNREREFRMAVEEGNQRKDRGVMVQECAR